MRLTKLKLAGIQRRFLDLPSFTANSYTHTHLILKWVCLQAALAITIHLSYHSRGPRAGSPEGRMPFRNKACQQLQTCHSAGAAQMVLLVVAHRQAPLAYPTQTAGLVARAKGQPSPKS